MKKATLYRFVMILGVLAASCVAIIYYQIRLGLDLRGGIHLLLRVHVEDAIEADLEQTRDRLATFLNESGISYESLKSESNRTLLLTGIPSVEIDRAEDLLSTRLPGWTYNQIAQDTFRVGLSDQTVELIKAGTIEQALESIRRRVNEYGVTEPTIQRQGLRGERLVVQLPGVENPGRLKNLIKEKAFLEWQLLAGEPTATEESLLAQFEGELPDGIEMLPGGDGNAAPLFYPIKKAPIITGNDIISARRSADEFNTPSVSVSLNPRGATMISRISAENVGTRMAIVLDNTVISAPVIQSQLFADIEITGTFTAKEADDLALQLRSGALPAGIEYLEERTVGPSLGLDSIRQGLGAAALGLGLVMIFLLVYYKFSGINAVLALLLNLVLMLGAMAYLGATLTLPGIAGFILTIGMAVDANVLIFERIKEELRVGRSVQSAIELGFSRAFSAIVDANVTTLIAAAFLFQFGTGPIKGFAVVLSFGILASLFTAIYVSKSIFRLVLEARQRRIKALSI